MTHTPGPWVVSGYTVTDTMRERLALGSVHWAVAQENEDGPLLALCGDEPGEHSISAADARLIAAAPELLEALKNLVDTLNNNGSTAARLDATAFAMAAIAKAEGK